MKKIIIYYFSGTGNTWWLATGLQAQLKLKGHSVDCYSIETLAIEDLTQQAAAADHIILGFPVYGSTAPGPMLDFINLFPDSHTTQGISIFATQALASGDTAYEIGLKFIRKGYDLKQTRHFRMMNNLHLPKFRFYKPKNDARVDKLLEQNRPLVSKFAAAISADCTHIIGNNPLGHLLGNLQRKHIDRLIASASKELKTDASRCTLCGTCQRICPTGNIELSGDSVRFYDQCALCLRCYSQCPTAAILLGEGSEDEKKFPRYKGPGKDFNVDLLIQKK
ncbi:EFR1 family ferrodoxin [Acetobacterium bakii]|uniref:4Fe-4S ferredoxin n=1 Tax=Acetobacterium bakii TaxID=52689 RepID=A0A0L6TYE2_9FIRM|nr:EFR1 family ferrodoxin [Acetobacterium bakii]KNZ41289.1 hypothetical protein AKG39_13350 [Acetobacterium bakii]